MIRIMANSSNNNGQTPGIDPALISAQRLQPYVARCKGDVTVALDLYLRDRSLGSSLFHDLAIIEVALRNSIDKALVSKYGLGWHRLTESPFPAPKTPPTGRGVFRHKNTSPHPFA